MYIYVTLIKYTHRYSIDNRHIRECSVYIVLLLVPYSDVCLKPAVKQN